MTIVLDNPKLEQDIPLELLHADPVQPRVHPDADLAESIKTQGILQAITVQPLTEDSVPDTICPDCDRAYVELAAEGGHLLILDGERRYRGTIAAGRKTILGKVVPPSSEGARLLRQLTSNTGKPLSPVEESFAFQRLMESEEWSQAELARQLGRPRSVVGDRIRLVELDQAWLAPIADGRLQVSHAAILSTFSAVPAEYQAKAAKIFFEDYRVKRYTDGGGSVPVDDMPRLLYVAFRDYIKETSKTPGYRGPTIEIKDQYSPRKSKYAADITLWRPCFRAYEKQERKAHASGGRSSSYSGGGSWLSAPEKAVKALKAAGFDPPLRPVGNKRVLPEEGEVVIHSENGWPRDIHPKVLLAKIDPTKITYVKGNFGGDELFTSDAAAVSAAREAYRQHVDEAVKKEIAPLRDKLTEKVLHDHAVTGPGAVSLLSAIGTERGAPKVVALALGLTIAVGVADDDGFEDDADLLIAASRAHAERLLSALAAVGALKIELPDDWRIGQLIRKGISDVPFKVAKSEPKKSKKQQKREARAAGKQVGDPSRAHDDNLHGLLDEEFVEEEQLEEVGASD